MTQIEKAHKRVLETQAELEQYKRKMGVRLARERQAKAKLRAAQRRAENGSLFVLAGHLVQRAATDEAIRKLLIHELSNNLTRERDQKRVQITLDKLLAIDANVSRDSTPYPF